MISARRPKSALSKVLLTSAFLLISASAYGKDDCVDDMTVDLTGVVKEIVPNKGGGLTVFLTNGFGKCVEKTGHIAVDKPIRSSCRVGSKIAAKVTIMDVAGEFWMPDRTVSYSCN